MAGAPVRQRRLRKLRTILKVATNYIWTLREPDLDLQNLTLSRKFTGFYFPLVICILCRLDTDQTLEEPLLQVIFSPPMLRDLKKLESSQVSGITQIQPSDKPDTAEKLPDSEDDRGE